MYLQEFTSRFGSTRGPDCVQFLSVHTNHGPVWFRVEEVVLCGTTIFANDLLKAYNYISSYISLVCVYMCYTDIEDLRFHTGLEPSNTEKTLLHKILLRRVFASHLQPTTPFVQPHNNRAAITLYSI